MFSGLTDSQVHANEIHNSISLHAVWIGRHLKIRGYHVLVEVLNTVGKSITWHNYAGEVCIP